MDITKVIDKYGLEKAEKYFSLYIKSRYERGGVANLLLKVIDEKFLKFTDEEEELKFEDEEIRELLICLKHFINAAPVFY
nr:p9 protein [Cucurbit yellow stunting disorder virus]WIA47369.1 p9 [chieh-qua chlorotic virus]WIA47382.1 p9 [chieh-qua chlorotic virus]WIA47395.1 p9 [chieh-qua chlorotic virus]WIA47408.1 p9 [chieh-qua chlorotic virus]